jgi:hypothetical protein
MSLRTGPLTEAIQSNKKFDWSDVLHTAGEVTEPFLALLKSGKKPVQKESNWPVFQLGRSGYAGALDGAPAGTANNQSRDSLKSVAQWVRKVWSVSHYAELTEAYGVSDEVKFQKEQALKDLRQGLEMLMLSAQDCAVESGETPNKTRGAAMWLANSGHNAEYPIASDFVVSSGSIYTGTLAAFDAAACEAVLRNASMDRYGAVTLDAQVGPALKARMDDYGAHDIKATSSNAALKMFNAQASDKEYLNVIDFFQFSSGLVRTHLNYNLWRDAAGAKTAVLSNAGGLFLDMKMWEIAFMDAINHDDLPFDGGSKKGQWHATAMLKCFMPKGQAMITPSAEALS